MRIGVITYDYLPPIGGLGRSVTCLLKALKSGFSMNEYLVFSPSLGADCRSRGVSAWMWGKRGGCPLFSLSLLLSLSRIISKHSLHIIHVHAGSGGVFILRKPACRMIVTAHHTYRQEATSVYGDRPIRRRWKLLMAVLERRTYNLADKIICVSTDTRAELIAEYGISAHKVIVIDNSIDIERFAHRNGYMKDGNTITYLGRIEERKGIWVLLRAFSKLRRKHPLLKLRLIGENLLGRALLTSPEFRQVSDVTTIINSVNDEDFLKEIQQATIVVVPSLVEGFGLIAAEAMAAGTFVVASACAGLRQVITHRKTGLLFKPGDSESCAQSIEEGLLSADLRHHCEQQAAREAMERFSPSVQAMRTQECYDKFAM